VVTTERAIEQHVADHAARWFPDEHVSSTVRVRQLSSRPKSLLYAVHLGDVTQPPRVLAKVRRGSPSPARGAGGRPRLSDEPVTLSELTHLEFTGLQRIHGIFGPTDPEFATLRPLDHLPEQNAILMDFVQAPTLRRRLVEQSRLARRRSRSGRQDVGPAWQRAGAWLRTFQGSMPPQGLPARQSTRDEVVDRFEAYDEFLRGRLGRRSAGDLGKRGAEIAVDVLSQRLPMAVGHGDYAPRNVFLGSDGRLTVFDPLPRWVVPRHEDLCRFLVGTRLLGLQLHTHGLAYAQQEVERRELEVIRGYGAVDDTSLAQLRCYELLILLDKWSALVDASPGGWRSRVRTASIELASGYVRGQARQLLALAGSAATRPQEDSLTPDVEAP
jgi:hypothetical protein